MANTKQTIIDAIATALTALPGVAVATRDLKTPKEQRSSAPYVGIISMNNAVLVDDGTNILWVCDLELILTKSGDDIEQLVDVVRDAMLDGMAATVGAREFRVVAEFEVAQVKEDTHSSSRLFFEMRYNSTRGAS